ncbi:hypothetical protein [Methanocalculus sp. MSAO_Arc2]|uniref:hypothetical protein n=1 Tax=Methanocalculus sp. MSAO_Arc2 TaxID=2293855 RepID=UPI0032178AAA
MARDIPWFKLHPLNRPRSKRSERLIRMSEYSACDEVADRAPGALLQTYSDGIMVTRV